jgi:acyl carrier protein
MTESTLALQYFADHDTRVLGQQLPVGHPVPGIGLRLLNAKQEAPPWRGEIGLSSPFLAAGYLGRLDIVSPDQPRLWHTGDLARRLPDGQLLHLGRGDDQLKIRGIRVEPAEIEAVLRADPLIPDCVVVAREVEPGEVTLVAYVTTSPGFDAQALRARLRGELPEYLVPSLFMPLAALPRLANGKVDRHALPDPAPDAPSSRMTVPPRNEIEERLAALWCGVLKREGIGIHDDFFALGGHSLLATRLIARVRDAFGLEVPLIALFEGPTIAGMADAVERAGARAPEPGPPALVRRHAAGSDSA